MIRAGKEEDKKTIYDIYSRGNSSGKSMDGYFAVQYVPENVFVNEVNGHIAASMQVNYCPMMLDGRKIAAAMMFAMFYDRNKSSKYLDALKEEAFNQQQFKSLITVVPTESETDFKKYGFEPVYKRRLYTINRSDLDNASYQNVDKQYRYQQLADLYNTFMANFNGYIYRDTTYFKNLIELIHYQKYNLAVYHGEDGNLQGYVIYYIENSKVVVEEIVYLNGEALTRLLCYCLRLKTTIQVYVSEYEDLSRAFPKIKYKTVINGVAKINDLDLFNQYFKCNVSSCKEALEVFNKPLFFNEFY